MINDLENNFNQLLITDKFCNDYSEKLVWLLLHECGPDYRNEIANRIQYQKSEIGFSKTGTTEVTLKITLKNPEKAEDPLTEFFMTLKEKDRKGIEIGLKYNRLTGNLLTIFNKHYASKYQGTFDKNNRPIEGTYTYNDGRQYRGRFLDGMKHGSGRLEFIDGTLYEGNFKNDRMDGQGTIIWKDGRKFIGYFYEGDIRGLGTYSVPSLNHLEEKSYHGYWKNYRTFTKSEAESNYVEEEEDWGDFLAIEGYQYPREDMLTAKPSYKNEEFLAGGSVNNIKHYFESYSIQTLTNTTNGSKTGGNNTLGNSTNKLTAKRKNEKNEEFKGDEPLEIIHKKYIIKTGLSASHTSQDINILDPSPQSNQGLIYSTSTEANGINVEIKQMGVSSNNNEDTMNINNYDMNGMQQTSKSSYPPIYDSEQSVASMKYIQTSYPEGFSPPPKKKTRNTNNNSIPNKSRANVPSDFSLSSTANSSLFEDPNIPNEILFLTSGNSAETPNVVYNSPAEIPKNWESWVTNTKGADLAFCNSAEPAAIDLLTEEIPKKINQRFGDVLVMKLAIKKIKAYLQKDYHNKSYKKSTVKKLRFMFGNGLENAKGKDNIFTNICQTELGKNEILSVDESILEENIRKGGEDDKEFRMAVDDVSKYLGISLKNKLSTFYQEFMSQKNKYASHYYNGGNEKKGQKIDIQDENLVRQRKEHSWRHVMSSIGLKDSC